METLVTGLGPTLLQYDLILTPVHLQRANFHVSSHSQVLGVRIQTHTSGGRDSTHYLRLLYFQSLIKALKHMHLPLSRPHRLQ